MKHVVLAVLLAFSVPLEADRIATLASGSTQGPLDEVAKSFERETGHQVAIQFDTSQGIAKRLAGGETPDVLIASVAGVDQAIKEGKAIAATRAPVGRIDMGVADAIKAKIVRVPTGAAVMQRLGAARTNELGFTMTSELKFGESQTAM